MSQRIDDYGTLITYQGDDIFIPFEGLPSENLTLYVAIQNEKRQPMGSEQSLQTFGATDLDFPISNETTDLLVVNPGDDYTDYYYGAKTKDSNGKESTLMIGRDADFGTLNVIRVYPRKVKGD